MMKMSVIYDVDSLTNKISYTSIVYCDEATIKTMQHMKSRQHSNRTHATCNVPAAPQNRTV